MGEKHASAASAAQRAWEIDRHYCASDHDQISVYVVPVVLLSALKRNDWQLHSSVSETHSTEQIC